MNNQINIIPCSRKKMPVPCPAWLMYSSSPVFSQRWSEVQKNGLDILILSGKHGILDPYKMITPYDQRIKNTPVFMEMLRDQVKGYEGFEFISYCSNEYNEVLELVLPSSCKLHKIMEGLTMFMASEKLKGSKSIKGSVFPIQKLLIWFYENAPVQLSDIEKICRHFWTNPVTQKCQYERLIFSPFAKVKGRLIYYAFEYQED